MYIVFCLVAKGFHQDYKHTIRREHEGRSRHQSCSQVALCPSYQSCYRVRTCQERSLTQKRLPSGQTIFIHSNPGLPRLAAERRSERQLSLERQLPLNSTRLSQRQTSQLRHPLQLDKWRHEPNLLDLDQNPHNNVRDCSKPFIGHSSFRPHEDSDSELYEDVHFSGEHDQAVER